MKNTYKQSKIIQKPWGFEEIWADCESYLGKIIVINPGHRLSRQYHEFKEETIRVSEGSLTLEVGTEESLTSSVLVEGDTFHVTPGTVHRFCNYGNSLVKILEVSTFHPQDVVRLEDDYNR